jgi:sugar-specific transcriptional regulator TrmB
MAIKVIEQIQQLGFTEAEAKIYLATLELGEATVVQIANQSKLKRTSVYYMLEGLKKRGVLIQSKRAKKIYYIAIAPKELLKRTRESIFEFENSLEEIEAHQHKVAAKPRVSFLYGPQGFKHIWEMIFNSQSGEYKIITDGSIFLDFVKEGYILDAIISKKKQLRVQSQQLITDSPYARKIIAKDRTENRQSKLLPARYKIPFTEIISDDFVAFVSPRWQNVLYVTENKDFADTRRAIFDIVWQSIV